MLLQPHLPCNCWLLLPLSLDAQLLSLQCDLQKQYPHSLQRVRCSICLIFNMPADLHLAFLFEAEQSKRTLACLTPARMPNLSTLRSSFQVSSSAVPPYIISHKPHRIQVKHCPHWFLNHLLHRTATETSQNALLPSLDAIFASSRPKK